MNKKDPRGRACALFEDRGMNDEEVARISKYFACYKVDISSIDPKNLATNNIKSVPTLLVTDKELFVVATIADHKLCAAKLLAMLVNTLQKKLPEDWAKYTEDKKKSETLFAEGAACMKEKQWADALLKFQEVIKIPATPLTIVKRADSQLTTCKAKLESEQK